MKDRNHMFISINAEKAFNKHPFLINLKQIRYKRNVPQYSKDHV